MTGLSMEEMLNSTQNEEFVELLARKNGLSVPGFCKKEGLKHYRVTKRLRYIGANGARYNDSSFTLYAPNEMWIRQRHNARTGLPVVKIEEIKDTKKRKKAPSR